MKSRGAWAFQVPRLPDECWSWGVLLGHPGGPAEVAEVLGQLPAHPVRTLGKARRQPVPAEPREVPKTQKCCFSEKADLTSGEA